MRMGRDKGLIELGGVPLIVRTANLLERLVAKVTVVGGVERYATLGLNAIPDQLFEGIQSAGQDERPGQGPLLGIATALDTTRAPWNLILACDLPYLSAEWLGWLLGRASRSRAQVVLTRARRGLEPLAAVYRRECSAPIAAALARGVRKVTDALQDLRVEAVDAREWRVHAPGERVLRNMNTPKDYGEAKLWWEKQAPRVRADVRPVRRSPKRKSRAAPLPNK